MYKLITLIALHFALVTNSIIAQQIEYAPFESVLLYGGENGLWGILNDLPPQNIAEIRIYDLSGKNSFLIERGEYSLADSSALTTSSLYFQYQTSGSYMDEFFKNCSFPIKQHYNYLSSKKLKNYIVQPNIGKIEDKISTPSTCMLSYEGGTQYDTIVQHYNSESFRLVYDEYGSEYAYEYDSTGGKLSKVKTKDFEVSLNTAGLVSSITLFDSTKLPLSNSIFEFEYDENQNLLLKEFFTSFTNKDTTYTYLIEKIIYKYSPERKYCEGLVYKVVGDYEPQLSARHEYYTIPPEPLDFVLMSEPISTPSILFPNPVKDFLRIKAGRNYDGIIAIHDLSGNKILEKYTRTSHAEIIALDLRFLPAGNYILRLIRENEMTENIRFIKQ